MYTDIPDTWDRMFTYRSLSTFEWEVFKGTHNKGDTLEVDCPLCCTYVIDDGPACECGNCFIQIVPGDEQLSTFDTITHERTPEAFWGEE